MNYIKQLQVDIDARKAEKLELSNGINELKGYLSSSKFWIETTVQVVDLPEFLPCLSHAQHQPRLDECPRGRARRSRQDLE